MTGGSITVDSLKGVGVYSNGTSAVTNINGGTINISDGAIGLYTNNSIINTAGATYNISGGVNGKSVFAYNYDQFKNMTAGKINLTGANNSKVNINAGGIGFYVKGMSLDSYIDNLITNSGTGKLELVMTNSKSNLYVLDSPGGITQLSTISSLLPGTTLGTAGNVLISPDSVSDYGLLTLIKGELEINQNVNLDSSSDAYSKSDFVNSSVTLNAGINLIGGSANALGIGQRNYGGNPLSNLFIRNYGTISLTGNASTGIAADHAEVLNSTGALISVGDNGTGIYAANSSEVKNEGTINLTNNGVGIYGSSYFDGIGNPGYGTNNINIINSGSIVSTGTTGRNIGIYANNNGVGSTSSVVLNTGTNIDVSSSEKGIGVYTVNSALTVNDGKITVGKNGVGIFAKGTIGTINMSGANVIGIMGQNGAQIYNDAGATINVTGNDVSGIYLSGSDTKLVNNGTINITGTGLGITYTPAVGSDNIVDTSGTTKGSSSKQYNLPEMPTLVNSGVINVPVGGKFNYDGIRIIVTVDPSTNTPTTNSSSQVGFGGVIPDKFEVSPSFAEGTAADRYVLKNIFKNASGKGDYKSQSLIWDATAQGSDLVMTRKAYTQFTDGLWFEDFGKTLNEKYAVTHRKGRKIYDKINYIKNEEDFRHIMASLAGNVYANINQRENDIARTFENSLYTLQDSKNNTKENVKMNIITGKRKNKEETDGVIGYDYETVGVLALREVERTYKHTFGYSLGYLHTGFEFKDGNESEEGVDTVQLVCIINIILINGS